MNAFLPGDPATIWLVEVGSVDLFLVADRDGELVGARHHVMRVPEGAAIFGVRLAGSSSVAVLAAPTPDSVVREMSRHAWLRAVDSPLERERAARVLDDWLGGLSVAAGEQRLQKTFFESPALLDEDALWAAFDEHTTTIVDRLVRNLERTKEREQARLERKERGERRRLDRVLRLLSSPLGAEEPTADNSAENPWLLACRAVGQAAGIEFKPPPDRASWNQQEPIAAIARASGVRARTVALKGEWWRQDVGPMVATRSADGVPVAVLPRGTHRYAIHDLVSSCTIDVNEEVAAGLQPFAWCFYRPLPGRALDAFDLLRFGLAGCRRDLMTVVLMGVGSGLLGLVLPIVTGIIFDSIIPGSDRRQLLQIVAIIVVVSICGSLFQLAQSFSMRRLEAKMDASTQAAVWDRLLALPVPFFRGYTAGDLAVRSLSISEMRQTLTGTVVSSLLSGVFSVFSFALLFYYSWTLAVLATLLALVALLATLLAGALDLRYRSETMAVAGRLSGMLLQFVNGISKLRVAGAENRAFAVWAREFTRKKQLAIRSRHVSIAFSVFMSVFPVLSSAAIFWTMSAELAQPDAGVLSTGAFLAFNAAFLQFQLAALSWGSACVALLSLLPLYERARPILSALPETDRDKTHPGELTGLIEIKHVSFRYRPDTPLVLRDISMKFPAGRFVAIVGTSGSGKSTLLRLLMGFETPESGAIYFDNQDRAHLDIRAVRSQMGVVLQSGRLMADSLYRNLVGSSNLTVEDAWDAAAMAGLEQDIKSMPMGMQTLVSEGSGGLSGGQRQRVMIARAIVKRPRILLFDEATSALDNETQATVSQSLERLQATRVIIAHRLSTIVHADYIYVLDRGQVVQEGVYRELIQQPGAFALLAQRQTA